MLLLKKIFFLNNNLISLLFKMNFRDTASKYLCIYKNYFKEIFYLEMNKHIDNLS